jgi:hypothetical protein
MILSHYYPVSELNIPIQFSVGTLSIGFCIPWGINLKELLGFLLKRDIFIILKVMSFSRMVIPIIIKPIQGWQFL